MIYAVLPLPRTRMHRDAQGQLIPKPPRSLIALLSDVFVAHRTWEGRWCIPMLGFDIDGSQAIYRCLTCQEEWPLLVPPPGTGWQPISAADIEHAVIWILLWNGVEEVRGHFARNFSGEEQPPFEGWFAQSGPQHYREIIPTPTHWKPLPESPTVGMACDIKQEHPQDGVRIITELDIRAVSISLKTREIL